eukprot:jgi/Ulvmu1/4417/UM002_0142.1
MVRWALGFTNDQFEPRALLRHRFPSKVGGSPAWLNPVELPTQSQLLCSITGEPLRFLLQVYAAPQASAPDDHAGAFHRTIFVFVSPRGDRLDAPGAVRAFRCQLPRVNQYYRPEPSNEEAPPALAEEVASVSALRDPWHKPVVDPQVSCSLCVAPRLFKELELIVDAEDEECTDEEADAPSSTMQRRIDEYNNRVQQEGEMSDSEAHEVDKFLTEQESEDDKYWANFQAVTSAEPECVLRHSCDSAAKPLWGRSKPLPDSIPPCPRCGKDRRFEFQVMPQLLSFLDIDETDAAAPDWLTIAVYTCARSCVPADGAIGDHDSAAYAEEYVFVQPPYTAQ